VASPEPPTLRRRLGTADAVTIGLGSMLGAGIFVVLAPAAAAAGSALLLGLALAAGVAYCNAASSARLAAIHPRSGGTYVYGRERLGPFWGFLAGWSFVAGKTASCAAMALTVGVYLLPSHAHAIAVVSVAALTAVNTLGVQKSAWLVRAIVAVVLGVLATVVVVIVGSGNADASRLSLVDVSAPGVLQAAALTFFAFAGYARIATLGEEVRDPAKTIPRAIGISLGLALLIYALVAVAVLAELGSTAIASTTAPLIDAVTSAGHPALAPVVRVGAAVAALGALIALILGVSRTALAMARDRHLPHVLASVHPRFGTPYRAEVAVGVVVALLAAFLDLRGAIGFSSFAVLVYYAIANASAFTLGARVIPVAGLVGCLVLAFTLPVASVAVGIAVLVIGATAYAARRWASRRRPNGSVD
jgi:APA family basic amino acid/polyamine antiporter